MLINCPVRRWLQEQGDNLKISFVCRSQGHGSYKSDSGSLEAFLSFSAPYSCAKLHIYIHECSKL